MMSVVSWMGTPPTCDLTCPATEQDMFSRKFFATATLACIAVAPVGAQTLQNQAGLAYYAPSIGNFSTLGTDLFGMMVSGTFSDGQTFTGNWVNLGGGLTGVNFTGRFSLTIGAATNTFGNPFSLTVFGTANTLKSLTLSGASGPVVFDRTFGGAAGTPGSSSGYDFAYSAADPFNTLVTYKNAVQLVGSIGPVGDVFESLQIDFRTAFVGTNSGRRLDFFQDVDNVIVGGYILPVPEPDGRLLTAAGLSFGFLALRRRRLVQAVAKKLA